MAVHVEDSAAHAAPAQAIRAEVSLGEVERDGITPLSDRNSITEITVSLFGIKAGITSTLNLINADYQTSIHEIAVGLPHMPRRVGIGILLSNDANRLNFPWRTRENVQRVENGMATVNLF